MGQTFAVDIESVEDEEHIDDRNVPVDRPQKDVEIFLAGNQAVYDSFEEKGFVLKAVEEDAKVVVVEFDPESFALEVFQPAGTQIATPVLPDPVADGEFPQIAASSFAFDPFEAVDFLLTVRPDAALCLAYHNGVLRFSIHEIKTSFNFPTGWMRNLG